MYVFQKPLQTFCWMYNLNNDYQIEIFLPKMLRSHYWLKLWATLYSYLTRDSIFTEHDVIDLLKRRSCPVVLS